MGNVLSVSYFKHKGMEHNWNVYRNGVHVGYVHCTGDGEGFGGSFDGDNQTWDVVTQLCSDDLAEIYFLDRMLEVANGEVF